MHPALSDLIGLSASLSLYPFVIILPGFLLGLVSNVFDFRQEGIIARLLISVVLSLSVFPILYYLLLRIIGFGGVGVIIGTALIITLIYFLHYSTAKRRRYRGSPSKYDIVILILLCWSLLAFVVIDLQIDNSLISNLMTYDYVKHIAVTNSISHSGVPPVNPSFYPGEAVGLFYYYFWFIFPSLVDQIGGSLVGPRDAVLGGVLFSPIGLVGITWLFVKKLGRPVLPEIDAKYFPLILSMLAITGLDLFPLISHSVLEKLIGIPGYSTPSIEWWNEQVASWLSAVVWVPHHISGFVATMFVFVVIRAYIDEQHQLQAKRWMIILCGLSLPSAFGMSIWVSLTFISFLCVWFIFALTKGYKDELWLLTKIGVLSAVLVIPYVLELQEANHLSGMPVVPSVRAFNIVDEFTYDLGALAIQIGRFVFLPLNYLLEFGFFFLGGIVYVTYRMGLSRKVNRQEEYVFLLLLVSLFICSFFKSNIKYNDLGWRGIMFAQVVLLLYSSPLYLSIIKRKEVFNIRFSRLTRVIAVIMLVAGVSANIYELYILRTRSLGPGGREGVELRALYEWIHENTPTETVIQHNPSTDVEYYHALYGNRQVALSDETLGKLYGISDQMYDELRNEIVPLLESSIPKNELIDRSRALGVDIWVVKIDDPVWNDTTAGMHNLDLLFENSIGKVYKIPDLN